MDPECLCDRGERERRIAVLLLHQLFRGQNVLILRLQIAAAAQLDDLPQQRKLRALILPRGVHLFVHLRGGLKDNTLHTQFGIQLFLANGWCPCSADALCNRPAEESPYKEIFAKASAVLSQHKLQRYSVAQIKRLYQFADALSGRECTVCGRVDNLQENRCPWCRAFENISRKLQNPQYTAFCITRDSSAYDLTLPDRNGQDVSLLLLTEDEAAKQIAQDRQMIRLHGKNRTILGAQICTRLDLCDYYASNLNTSLAAQAEGIRRLAICRMDVDNLGEAFVSGFEQKDKPLPKER